MVVIPICALVQGLGVRDAERAGQEDDRHGDNGLIELTAVRCICAIVDSTSRR